MSRTTLFIGSVCLSSSNLIIFVHEQVEDLQDEIEQQLVLLGATAIEDRLGPNVPESIQYLREVSLHLPLSLPFLIFYVY
jgi:magnesium-transporting ATPase (P-type)